MAATMALRTAMPVRCSPARPAIRTQPRSVRMRASGTAVDQSELEAAIKQAEEASASNKAARQKAEELAKQSNAAWEKVEALKAKARDPNAASSDPLEDYCAGDPSADECRVYED